MMNPGYGECLSFILFLLCTISQTQYPGFNDSTVRQIVQDFRELCPYTGLCHIHANQSYTYRDFSIGPCCHSCECDQRCGHSCCPDALESSMTESEFQSAKSGVMDCVHPQFRSYDADKYNTRRAFKFSARCPGDFHDKNVKLKCEQDYWDFDFEDDAGTMVPLSSSTEKVTYKNYFCWLCNDGQRDGLMQWSAAITCQYGDMFINNILEIREKLKDNELCNLIFLRPDDNPPGLVSCRKLIDRCNVTGNWMVYDRFLEEACLSYKSVYNSQFKNVHCFLCNGYTEAEVSEECDLDQTHTTPHSFIALLDFHDFDGYTREDTPDASTDCPQDSYYDKFTRACRQLACAKGMIISDGRCTPFIQNVESSKDQAPVRLGIDITLSLELSGPESTHAFSERTIWFLNDIAVADYIQNRFFMFQNPMALCNIFMFEQLKSDIETTQYDLSNISNTEDPTCIAYIAANIKMTTYIVTNISHMIDEVSKILTFSTRYGVYRQVYRNIDLDLFHKYSNDPRARSSDNQSDDPFIVPLKRHNDNMFCESAISVEPNPFCGKACIPKESVTQVNEEGVWFVIDGVTLSMSSFIISETDNCIYVCWDDFLSKMDQHASEINDKQSCNKITNVASDLVILTIVCLLCSLVSLIITFGVYCLLPNLRSIPGLNNMALCASLFIYQSLMLVNSLVEVTSPGLCSAVGLLLHLFLISSLCWMLICTLHMTKVFLTLSPTSTSDSGLGQFGKYFAVCAVASALHVIAVVTRSIVTADRTSSLEIGYGGTPCYIKNPQMVFYFVAIPLAVVLVSNLLMFLLVVFKISRLPDMGTSRNNDRNNITIFAKLSTITGLTWIFGLLFQFSGIMLFAYLFIIFNGGQGVLIMFAFIVNSRVYNMLVARRANSVNSNGRSEQGYPGNGSVSHGTTLTKF